MAQVRHHLMQGVGTEAPTGRRHSGPVGDRSADESARAPDVVGQGALQQQGHDNEVFPLRERGFVPVHELTGLGALGRVDAEPRRIGEVSSSLVGCALIAQRVARVGRPTACGAGTGVATSVPQIGSG